MQLKRKASACDCRAHHHHQHRGMRVEAVEAWVYGAGAAGCRRRDRSSWFLGFKM